MTKNTKVKGNNAELEALAFFKRHGFSVSIPFGDNDPYDLIVEAPSRKLYRVQVRWASWQRDSLALNLRSSTSRGSRTLDLSRIDAFVAWDGTALYIVPTCVLGDCRAAFTLRRGDARNGQKRGIHLAEEFVARIDLLP